MINLVTSENQSQPKLDIAFHVSIILSQHIAEDYETDFSKSPLQTMLCGSHSSAEDQCAQLSLYKPCNPNVLLQLSWLTLVLSKGMNFSGHLST